MTDLANEVLRYPLFTLGGTQFTAGTLLYLVVSLILLIFISGRLKKWIVEGPLAARQPDRGIRFAVGAIVRYLFVFVGFIVIVQTAGVDLSSLTLLAGALGIGIGFGMQNVTNNLVCGLMILFERPIKVGDRIEVGTISGDVVKISPRATTVQTNDNISYIIPNSEFITSTVINWSHTDQSIRLHVPVGVSYGSDPERVKALLLGVADAEPGVLKRPETDVVFNGFGESALEFDLRIWTSEFMTRPMVLTSRLNFAIWNAFHEHGIEIPFPQRDVHIKSGIVQKDAS